MSVNWKKTFNWVALIAMICIAIAVLISAVTNNVNVYEAFITIALVLAVIVCAFYSFFVAYRRGSNKSGQWTTKQIVLMCVWVASVILAFVGIILLNVL